MDPKFFRKYADLIESAENNKPVLTEGMLNDIKTQAMALFNKAKAMPGFSQAYQKAKTMTPQVQAILKTSKSGEEAMGRIQQLAKAPANENAFSQAAGVAAGAVGGIGAVATPFSSICAKLLDPLLTSAQATTFALPMLATSIALIGLGILLSTFTKGNIPGSEQGVDEESSIERQNRALGYKGTMSSWVDSQNAMGSGQATIPQARQNQAQTNKLPVMKK